ncbi:MAG TPA: type II secretion system protein GspN [Polyangiaceae bacterium]|nr:type II secretion system protein GspN [Polyangiaceae bacterium]
MMGKLLASPWVRRVGRWLGYPAFYCGAMLLFARCTFPYDRLGERVVATFNAAEAKKTGRRVEVDTVRGNWLFGIGARGLRLVSPPGAIGEDGVVPAERVVEWDYARASIAPLRYLIGTLKVAFVSHAGEGVVRGTFLSKSTERRLDVNLERFGMRSVPLLAEVAGFPLQGTATGAVGLVFPEQRLSLAEGTLELVVDDVMLGDGKTKIRDLVALPPVRAGQLTLSAEVTEGRVKINRLDAKGPDLEVSLRGQIRLRDVFERSTADLTLEYRFSDQYKTKNEITKGLFGDPQSKITGALDLDAKVQRAKRADGGYSWHVSGTLARMSFQPAAAGADAKAPRVRRTNEESAAE